ncbi:hypothetical protein DPMN_077823 [Dreissena polymorpha]|nr:hypothetical protein DPMN_077823 [Dreissena polymorpha]
MDASGHSHTVCFDAVNIERRFSPPDAATSWHEQIYKKILRSERGAYTTIKAVFGALVGVLIGAAFFPLCVYSFGYTYELSGYIASIATVLLILSLAFSSYCRCIVSLCFPNFFTGKGRAVLLTVLLSLIVSYPLENITNNAKETGKSMSCVVELAANQSRYLQGQLRQPVEELKAHIETQFAFVKRLSKTVKDAYGDATNALNVANDALDSTIQAINRARQECEGRLSSASSSCSNFCHNLPLSWIGLSCDSACSSLSTIGDQCKHLSVINDPLTAVSKQARDALNKAMSFFDVSFEKLEDFSASSNASKNFKDIKKEINEAIESKAKTLLSVFGIGKKVLSLSLLVLFVQSFLYLRNYLAKDSFDNIYITAQFRKLDNENKAQGRESVLPLKKKEKHKYVNTQSKKLNPSELAYCKLGLVQVLLHFIMCLLIVIFDLGLYYILDLVRIHGQVDMEVKGHGEFRIQVNGEGIFANFYRLFIDNLNLDKRYQSSVNVSDCLPDPSPPNYNMYLVFLIMYAVATAIVFLQGYGMRLRRIISAYFYPEQELARLDYLHKKISHQRVSRLKLLRNLIVSAHKESREKDSLRLSPWLCFKIFILNKIMSKEEKLQCLSCKQSESSVSHVNIRRCSSEIEGATCEGVYCDECWGYLAGSCALCDKNNVI